MTGAAVTVRFTEGFTIEVETNMDDANTILALQFGIQRVLGDAEYPKLKPEPQPAERQAA